MCLLLQKFVSQILCNYRGFKILNVNQEDRSVVPYLLKTYGATLVVKSVRSVLEKRRGKISCRNMLSLVSFAGWTLNKCSVLWIWTLTGGPLCRESHPL